MKKFLLSFGLLVVMLAPFSAHAVLQIACEPMDCLTGATTVVAMDENCETATSSCYGRRSRVYSCTKCKDGYTMVELSTTLGDCTGNVYYYGCLREVLSFCMAEPDSSCSGVASMTGMEHCTSTLEYCWGGNKVATCTACQDGYDLVDDKQWFLECSNAYNRKICAESTAVAITCKMGWYLNADKTGCIACPENTSTDSGLYISVQGQLPSCGLNSTTNGGKTGCYYLAASLTRPITNCEYSDDSGTYIYTEDCYYSD